MTSTSEKPAVPQQVLDVFAKEAEKNGFTQQAINIRAGNISYLDGGMVCVDAMIAYAAEATPVVSSEFLSIDLWDNRDEAVLLLVDYGDYGEHAIDDASVAITIGHNNDHNVGVGEGEGWQFAGWCWSHDHYTQGKGKVIGWLPLSSFHARARTIETTMYPIDAANLSAGASK